MVQSEMKDNSYTIRVKNIGLGNAKEVKYYYNVIGKRTVVDSMGELLSEDDITETKMISTGVIKSMRTTKRKSLSLDEDTIITDVKLTMVKVYSGNGVVTYNMMDGTTKLSWATPDTVAPTISGFVGENSHHNNIPYIVLYKDIKFDFTKYVIAEDDRDSKVEVVADTSKVNFDKNGVYEVTYSATDKAGNVSLVTGKVEVRVPVKVDQMASQVLSSIIKDGMTDKEKAMAIYAYIRKNVSYTDHSDKTSWEKMAEHGMKYKTGDCFVFYGMARALLTRAGIPNFEITKYGGTGRHWWNLVYVEGGWYHYDTTPRKKIATFCLLTDEQITAYSITQKNSHLWNNESIPERSTKEINKLKYKRY